MNKTITTNHPEIGYSNNVEIIAQALREHFGFDDNSHLQTAVAAHIWSEICASGRNKEWGTLQIKHALDSIRARLADLTEALGRISPEVAPLRLAGAIREHACAGKVTGIDVALRQFGTNDDSEPFAVVVGPLAIDLAIQILTAVNGRPPQEVRTNPPQPA